MTLELILLLVLAVLFTSYISGVTGMAGGLILLLVLLQFFSVGETLFFHGVIQLSSNFFRFYSYKEHTKWPLLLPYLLAWVVVGGILLSFEIELEKSQILKVLCFFPFLSFFSPKKLNIHIENKFTNFISHLFFNSSQVLVGVTGPVAALFFNSKLSRFEILGTLSLFQLIGHFSKSVFYFNNVASSNYATESVLLFLSWAIFASSVGNYLGKLSIRKIKEEHFKVTGKVLTLVLGIWMVIDSSI